MSRIHFDGPADLTPDLLMAMWNALPEESRKSLSQLFFSNYARPLPETVLASGAKAFFEAERAPKAARDSLSKAVAAKAVEIAGSMNVDQARTIVEEEFRRCASEAIRDRIADIMGSIKDQDLVKSSIPALGETIGSLGKQYFLHTQNGQARIMELINAACDGAAGRFVDMVESELRAAAKPAVDRRIGGILAEADAKQFDKNGKRSA